MAATLKPYPVMKESSVPWLGKVPAHWEVRRLKTLCSRSSLYGANIAADSYTTKGTRFLRTTDITEDGQLKKGGVFLPEELVHEYRLADGDVLISRSGTIGRSFLYRQDIHGPCAYAGYLVRFVPASVVVPEYIFLFTKTQAFAGFLRAMAISSTIENVNGEKYANCPLTIPPLAEQTAIVRFLNHADRRIQRYIRAKQKLITLLKEQRKNATQEAIQSSHTAWLRLETVADLIKRPVRRASNRSYIPIGLYNRGRGFFRKEQRNSDELGDSDFFWIEEGDLVISGQFAWEGAIALAGTTESGCVASHRYPILKGKPGVLQSDFLLAFFQTDWGQLLLDHHSRGAAGRNRPLNARTLMKEKIAIPPIQLQLPIVKMLQRELNATRQTETWARLLQEYRTCLIANVITGRLDVRHAAADLPEVDPLVPEDTSSDALGTGSVSGIVELDATLEEAEV